VVATGWLSSDRYGGARLLSAWGLDGRVVSVPDSGSEEDGFESQSRRCRVAVLGKLFTPIVPRSVSSALHPFRVAKSCTSFGWGEGGKVTSGGWQVTLCDPIW